MVVDLPAPLGPRKPTTCPRHVEGHVADGGVVAVVLGQVADVDHTALTRVSQGPGFQERLQQACGNNVGQLLSWNNRFWTRQVGGTLPENEA